jgi:hypothetical protein
VTNGSDADFTVVDIDECESVPAYEAELIFLRHGLGVGSFGMQVERLPAHCRRVCSACPGRTTRTTGQRLGGCRAQTLFRAQKSARKQFSRGGQ